MKKASLVNLFVILGLLVLCVTSLILVYAMAPESSVLLLEEGFDRLDESKWRHEEADCEEDGEQFHYVMAENRLIADGVLHIYPNMTNVHFRTKREAKGKCYSCKGSENSTADCVSSLFSAKLQTREAFEANSGRVEIRAKICCGGQVNFNIGITPNQNESHPEAVYGSFAEWGNATAGNASSQIRVSFESPSKKTFLTSAIADSEFHIYEINWKEESVSLSIDRKKVEEKRLEESELQEENISNGTVKLDSGPISKPFYFNVGVGFEGKDLDNISRHLSIKRSLNGTEDHRENNSNDWSVAEVDYIKIFKI